MCLMAMAKRVLRWSRRAGALPASAGLATCWASARSCSRSPPVNTLALAHRTRLKALSPHCQSTPFYPCRCRFGFGPFLVLESRIWSPNRSPAPLFRGGALGSGGLLYVEAAAIEPAARSFCRERFYPGTWRVRCWRMGLRRCAVRVVRTMTRKEPILEQRSLVQEGQPQCPRPRARRNFGGASARTQ